MKKDYFQQYLDERFQSLIDKLDEQTTMLSRITKEARSTNEHVVLLRRDVDELTVTVEDHEKRISVYEKSQNRLMTQISVFLALGALLMTFVYEYVKQFISNIFIQGR